MFAPLLLVSTMASLSVSGARLEVPMNAIEMAKQFVRFDAHIGQFCASNNNDKAVIDSLISCIYNSWDVVRNAQQSC